MKNLYKKISILSYIFIALVSLISVFVTNVNNTTSNNVVRNIEIEEINIDSNNSLEKFDNYDLTYNETSVSFVGYNIIDSNFFDDLDLVSVSNNNTVITKYECNYDYEYGIVSLSVLLIDNIESALLDTIYGVIITNDDNEFDVLFDVDGEILLLSELGDVSSTENCGFFSKLKKVWNTTSGKIGTIATVATCAVVGTICAVIPGGQLVTAACIGATVGLIGGAITAGVSTYLVDGKIDWVAVFSYAGAGAVVGGITSSISFGVASGIKDAIVASKKVAEANKKVFTSTDKLVQHFNKHSSEFGDLCTSVGDYLDAANYVIDNGQYVSQLNGYIRFFGANGKANYAFVGLTSDGNFIATFGIRSVSELSKYIPWLIC